MNPTIKEFVRVYNCDMSRLSSLFAQVDPSELKPHEWYDEGQKTIGQEACTSLIHQPEYGSELSAEMYNLVDSCFSHYVNDTPFPVSIYNSSVGRFNIYRQGDSMDEHVDHIRTLFTPPSRGIPILSAVGLVNDDFSGGEFTLCKEVMDLRAGDLVVFPSCFLYPHSVGEVTEGQRVSFVSWGW